MEAICREYGVDYACRPEWGNMQGMARMALDRAEADWLLIMSDDIILSYDFVKNVVFHCIWARREIGAFFLPRQEAWQVFSPDKCGKCLDCHHSREKMYSRPLSEVIPLIEPEEFTPSLYLGLHGSGIAVRPEVWRAVGGPNPRTACYDEDLAVKVWLFTPWCVGRIGGPAMLHFGGAAQNGALHPGQNDHTLDAWVEAWRGLGKSDLDWLMRRAMAYKSEVYGIPAV